MALNRNGSEWREAQRVQTDGIGHISCELSDSRVLVGQYISTYMELFRVESGLCIARVHRIHVLEKFCWFSATCGSDTLVAMSFHNNSFSLNSDISVHLHRLRGDRLEELEHIQLKQPEYLLWRVDRLLVADFDKEKKTNAVIQLKVIDTRFESRELIATSKNINVKKLCAVNDRLAILI